MFLIGYASCTAAVPKIVIMIVGIISTKIPILLGHEWTFSLCDLDRYGFLSFTHETRTDWAMLMGAIFMLLSASRLRDQQANTISDVADNDPSVRTNSPRYPINEGALNRNHS